MIHLNAAQYMTPIDSNIHCHHEFFYSYYTLGLTREQIYFCKSILKFTNQLIPFNFYLGVASNGFVWLDYLAQDLGDPLLDFAQLGARTYDFTGASGSRDGLLSQISQYSTEGVNNEALHTIWIGGNDLLNMSAPPDVTIFNAVSTIGLGIQTLYGQGARNFLKLFSSLLHVSRLNPRSFM